MFLHLKQTYRAGQRPTNKLVLIYWSQTSGKKIEMIRIDYFDVYYVTNIAWVVIGYGTDGSVLDY